MKCPTEKLKFGTRKAPRLRVTMLRGTLYLSISHPACNSIRRVSIGIGLCGRISRKVTTASGGVHTMQTAQSQSHVPEKLFQDIPSGMFAVYKPVGLTSHDVVSKIKGILTRGSAAAAAATHASRKSCEQVTSGQAGETNANAVADAARTNSKIHKFKASERLKIGHGGTLDPLASGVLVIGVKGGTKAMLNYLQGSKRYIVQAVIGFETDTQDRTGQPVGTPETAESIARISHQSLQNVLPEFRGEILQVPPMYSALKKDGRRLYELARKGIEVERQARPLTIYSLELLGTKSSGSGSGSGSSSGSGNGNGNGSGSTTGNTASSSTATTSSRSTSETEDNEGMPYFMLDVVCSGGTYIRTLVTDIARAANTKAHMTELERIQVGPFALQDCLHEQDWTYEKICGTITRYTQLHGIQC